MFVISLGIAAFFIVRCESKTWSLEVENRTSNTIAVIGITEKREGIDFELIEPGERKNATVGSDGIRPYGVDVQFDPRLDADGFPIPSSISISCMYDAAKEAEPLVVSGFESEACEEPVFD